jgi:hypothetical protein
LSPVGSDYSNDPLRRVFLFQRLPRWLIARWMEQGFTLKLSACRFAVAGTTGGQAIQILLWVLTWFRVDLFRVP